MEAAADIVDPGDYASPVFPRYYIPARPLSDFVGLFWYWRGNVRYSKERILPMGTAELVIDLGAELANGAAISGPRSRSLIIERTAFDELLGIHFNPGGAFPFLGFPFGDLHGLNTTLSELWGERRVSQLLCLLHAARTVEMKFSILERWLVAIATRPLKHHPAVSFAMKEFQTDPGLRSSAAT